MQLRNGEILFSPSDLNAFLECEHLTELELAVAAGELERPADENPQADLVKRKGDEHEAAYLAALLADGREVVTIANDWDLEVAAQATADAIAAGAEVIYQACFVDGEWRGFADFVERQADGRYEVVDTKLARHSKPAYVLQLCFYSEQVGRIQGAMPERMHVVLGNRERETLRVADFLAYYHRVRDRFVSAVEAGIDVYPLPVSYCDRCDFLVRCEERWRADDHLSIVARMRRDQTRRLEAAGIATVVELARAADEARPASMPPRTFETLRDQAAMQVAARANGHAWKVLAPEPARGFELLPPPTGGDLFFDIEGDPFWEPGRGLEYLWGIVDTAGRFTPFWAHDRAQERRAVEGVIDLIRERRAAHPAMHVYHYAAYEITALKRLTCEYGTREEELDDLLRGEVFVDLYKVVSQGLRLSHERYGLKQVETFYFERTADLRAGDDSILLYEDYLEKHDPAVLDAIAAYNEEDCLSTLGLRDWLLTLRPGPAPPPEEREPREPPADAAETEELRAALLAGLPDDHHDLAEADRPRWLLAQLLLYHRREEKPVWWSFFARIGLTPEELQERDSDAIGGLVPAGPPIGSGEFARLAVHLPRAAAPSRGGRPGLRPRDRRIRRHDRRARRGGRNAPTPTWALARGRPAARVDHPRWALPDPRAARRAPAARALGTRRRRPLSRGKVDPRPRAVPCSAPAGRPRRGEGARRGTRRPPPCDPGAARNRQDLHRRPAHRPPHAARPPRWRHRAEPQVDPQPDRGGRARGQGGGLLLPRPQEGRHLRRPLRHHLRGPG